MVRSKGIAGRRRETARRVTARQPVILALAFLVLAAGCRQQQGTKPSVPKVRARVITIRTTVIPGNKVFRHQVLYANGRVRLTSEVDQRRFFNLRDNTVTFVDDVARTYRNAPFAQLLAQRRTLLSRPAPARVPPAEIIDTGTQRAFGRFSAHQYLIRLGAYEREVWLSPQPLAGENFIPLVAVSEPISEPFASVMRPVHERMVTLRGFPILDRSTMKYDGAELKIEKVVENVEDKDVPQSWMTVPAGYRDITPAPPPKVSGAARPRASSPPRGRKARGVE